MELVDSVDELRSSSSTRGISMPNFEALDARIASARNKIIHNSQFKRRNQAWNLTKVRSKKEVIDEARTSGATVHFASLMDI